MGHLPKLDIEEQRRLRRIARGLLDGEFVRRADGVPVCSTCGGNCGQCGNTGTIGNIPVDMQTLVANIQEK